MEKQQENRFAELDSDECGEEGEEFGDVSQVVQGLGSA